MKKNDRSKVFIVDDHGVFVFGLKTFLQEQGFNIVGEANTGREAIELIGMLDVTDLVVLLDYQLADGNGVDFIPEIKMICPECLVLLLSGHSHIEYIIKALQGGASGYISKETDMNRMVNFIRDATKQKYYLDPHLSGVVCEYLIKTRSETEKTELLVPLSSLLTERQIAYLRLFAERKMIKEISKNLGITQNTIYVMKSKIKERLEIQDDMELRQFCSRYGLGK